MKWLQKYHVTSAIYNISSFASISQWACRSTPQPGQNRPDACSIGPTSARHGRSTWPLVHWYVWITQLFQYISIKSWKNTPMKMRQWQPIWQECLPRRIENATQPVPRAIVQSGPPRWQPQMTQRRRVGHREWKEGQHMHYICHTW